MDTATYLIHEAAGFVIEAEVDFKIQPAYGDGWNEPHEPAFVEIQRTRLIKLRSRIERDDDGKYSVKWDREDLGPAPQWVDDIIEAAEDWQNDLLANDGPDPDRAYDERRDLQLTDH
jgi:hypothetical protein